MKASHVKIKAQVNHGQVRIDLSQWMLMSSIDLARQLKELHSKSPQYDKVYLVYSVPFKSKKQQVNLLVGQNIRQISGAYGSCNVRIHELISFLSQPGNRFPKDYKVLNAAQSLLDARLALANAEAMLRSFLHEVNKEQKDETAQS